MQQHRTAMRIMRIITSFSSTSSINDLNSHVLYPATEVRAATSSALSAEASSTSATSVAVHLPNFATTETYLSAADAPPNSSQSFADGGDREGKMEFEMVFDEILAHAENQSVANNNECSVQSPSVQSDHKNISVKQEKVKQEQKHNQVLNINESESPDEVDQIDNGNGLNGVNMCEAGGSRNSANPAACAKQKSCIPEIPVIFIFHFIDHN